MPLSEQEQRLLDEMERHLMRNDADVVSAPRDGRTLSYRNIVYGTIYEKGKTTYIGDPPAPVATELVTLWKKEWRSNP